MSKKVVSPVWLSGGPALWLQPTRQTTLALSQLCAHLCVEQSSQPIPAAARVVRTLDCGRLHHPPVGRPEWVQPSDAPPADRVLVTPAAPHQARFLGVSPPAVRWHRPGSPQRRLCGDGCGPLCRGVCGSRDGGRPRPPAAVLRDAGPSRVSPPECHGRRQPAPATPVAPRVADDRDSTLSGPHSTPRPQLVSPVAETPRCPTTADPVLPRHGDPHQSGPGGVRGAGAGVGTPVRTAPGGPSRAGVGLQRSQTRPQSVARGVAEHVSLSRRSGDPEIHQRIRRVFRSTETQVPTTPRACAAPS